jgi:hypothetical protein
MPNNRPVPHVNTKEYASQGEIGIYPVSTEKIVKVEMHYCSVFLNEEEALRVALSLVTASSQVYGRQWVNKFIQHVEKL